MLKKMACALALSKAVHSIVVHKAEAEEEELNPAVMEVASKMRSDLGMAVESLASFIRERVDWAANMEQSMSKVPAVLKLDAGDGKVSLDGDSEGHGHHKPAVLADDAAAAKGSAWEKAAAEAEAALATLTVKEKLEAGFVQGLVAVAQKHKENMAKRAEGLAEGKTENDLDFEAVKEVSGNPDLKNIMDVMPRAGGGIRDALHQGVDNLLRDVKSGADSYQRHHNDNLLRAMRIKADAEGPAEMSVDDSAAVDAYYKDFLQSAFNDAEKRYTQTSEAGALSIIRAMMPVQ